MSNEEPNNPMPGVNFTYSPDFRTIYANWVQGAFSPFDISFLVGDGFPDGISGGTRVDVKARVVFSPVEAKLVIRILRAMVLSYEKQFGEIKIAENIMSIATTGEVSEIPTNDDSEGD